MLDLMRKKASSWMIKVIFTLIILTFIFFFGYSKIASRQHDERRYVAVVGSSPIPRRKFEATFESSIERMGEDIPENFRSFLRENILQQLITRELVAQYGSSLGLAITDEEIAETIQNNKNLSIDGHFDLQYYREKFLPYFQQRYGEEFEEVIKRDLLVEKMGVYVPVFFDPWKRELDASKPKPGKKDEAQAPSMSSEEIFSEWMEDFREKQKVQIFQ